MSFGVIQFTNRGKALQAKAIAGADLVFTRIGVGDGSLSGQAIADLNNLIHEVKSVTLNKFKTLPGGKAIVGGVLSNQSLVTGFYWRELGLFATDPDLGEILYCYGNAGDLAEYIPSPGGAEIIEKQVDIVAIIGNSSSVSATIEQSLIYATYEDINNLAGVGRTTETVKGNSDAIAVVVQDLLSHETADATTAAKGHIQLATNAEVTTGTDATKAVTPAGAKVELDKKINHSLATAANDFLVASGVGVFIKKTLAEVKTILGLGSAAYTASTDYAVSAKGVTNGDTHDHSGGDGAQINHTTLSNIGTNTHAQIDTHISATAPHSGHVAHSLATAANDFLVASGAGAWAKQTLAQVKATLGLGTAAYTASTAYATAAQGTAADNAMPKAGGTFTGAVSHGRNQVNQPKLSDYTETFINMGSVSGTATINLSNGNNHRFQPTAATTVAITNIAATGQVHEFTLSIYQGATAYAITWPVAVKWIDDKIPDLTTTSKYYDFLFWTVDGGTIWHGALVGKYSA